MKRTLHSLVSAYLPKIFAEIGANAPDHQNEPAPKREAPHSPPQQPDKPAAKLESPASPPQPPGLPASDPDPQSKLLLSGSLWKALWVLAWPLFLTMIATSIAGFMDAFVAGRIDLTAQAAIGIGDVVWFFVLLLASALATGTEALVSRHWGAGEKKEAIKVARQALLLAAAVGFLSSILGLIACKPLFRLVGAAPEVQESGWQYLRFNLSAVLPFAIIWTTNGIFRALGRTSVQMFAMTLVSALVILLDYLLCISPFQLGISGIGISWSIAGTLGAFVFIWRLRRSEMRDCVSWTELKKEGLDFAILRRLAAISGPTCLHDIAIFGANFFLLIILSATAQATSAQAAWAVGLKVQEMVALVPLIAIANAVAPIVGQNLGAGQPKRASKAVMMFCGVNAVIGYIFACTFMLAGTPIAQFMSNDPLVIEQAAAFLKVLGIAAPITAISLVLTNAMDGSGYTRLPTIISLSALVVVELPVAYLLACVLGLGSLGAWIGMLATTMVVAAAMAWLFQTGKWTNQKV